MGVGENPAAIGVTRLGIDENWSRRHHLIPSFSSAASQSGTCTDFLPNLSSGRPMSANFRATPPLVFEPVFPTPSRGPPIELPTQACPIGVITESADALTFVVRPTLARACAHAARRPTSRLAWVFSQTVHGRVRHLPFLPPISPPRLAVAQGPPRSCPPANLLDLCCVVCRHVLGFVKAARLRRCNRGHPPCRCRRARPHTRLTCLFGLPGARRTHI